MVRPRFTKLPLEQQQAILQAALDEFAAHGFHDASLNRVIDTAGISKGSMYYYFDGKEDLYAYLVRTELAGLFARVGTLPELDIGDADAFWAVLEDYYLQLMRALTASPQLAALLRGWAAASKNPAFQAAQGDIEQASLHWIEQALTAGQRVGAVRDDLPSSLLIAVVMGMGQAMDIWLMSQQPGEDTLPGLVSDLISMIRGAVSA
ncbi:TetR/AcrR family transcriptional regulator [Paenarthrobacter sp. PH39-S1]|uniref:TetR/AcrR family transcriptional regulator n=1 Tax=Paenarthrobacter sp. PH39-S1 TaxID=3046204 RepID=UPI0024B8A176|nr:TetR/AcrR family transcriptional regulator [Paenarthrobacter sp. PH39-S1]MDJ0356314.1 TetR/AcrR family transcriptional regulator [Paenarthrobacter sp. PH39-S1]